MSEGLVRFLQTLVGGLTSGAVYGLVALGFTLVYNVSRVINLAQGEFVALGALILITLQHFGVPLLPALVLSVLVSSLLGLAEERLGIRTARGASLSTLLIITIGASIFLRGTALVVWGRDPYSLPSFSGESPILISGVAIQPQVFWVLGTLLGIAFVLWFYFERTWHGKAMIACAENPGAASLVGINVRRMVQLSFAISAAIGALGGAVVVPITFMTYDAGNMLGLKGFVAAVIGGLGDNRGAVAGGLLLGLLEALAAGYVSSLFKETVALLVLLVLLTTRPEGLLGRANP